MAPKTKKKLSIILISASCIILAILIALGVTMCALNQGGQTNNPSTDDNSSTDDIIQNEGLEVECLECFSLFTPTDDEWASGTAICPHCGAVVDLLGLDLPIEEDPYEEDPYEEDPYEEDPYEEIIEYEELHVYNSETPIMTNFKGASSSIYHCMNWIPDKYNRHYVDNRMKEMELERVDDFGIKFARTAFFSQWAWDSTNKCFNFDTDRMKAFKEWAKELQKRDVDILITSGWHVTAAISGTLGGFVECLYMYGKEPGVDNLYGEFDGYDFSSLSEDDARLRKIGLRMANFIKMALEDFRSEGIYNIKGVFTWVEPSSPVEGTNVFDGTKWSKLGTEAYQLAQVVTGFTEKFRSYPALDNIKIIGPNQGNKGGADAAEETLTEFMLKYYPELYDIQTLHWYPNAPSITNTDLISENSHATYKSFADVMAKYDMDDKKEIWCDEFSAWADDATNGKPSGMIGLNNAIAIVSGMNYKVQNYSWWQMYDQLWTDHTSDSYEFSNGVHNVGFAPSLTVSSIPKPQYYGTGNLVRNIASDAATVYPVTDGGVSYTEVYMQALVDENGDWSVIVCNGNLEDTSFEISFDKAINKTLYRHMYEANDPRCSTAAHMIDPDRVYKDVKDVFVDTLPPASFAVYTSRQHK